MGGNKEITCGTCKYTWVYSFQSNPLNFIEQQPIQRQPPQEEPPYERIDNTETTMQDTHETMGVKRYSRIKRLTISSNFMVYLQESDYYVGSKDDIQIYFHKTWVEKIPYFGMMLWRIESMAKNKVWNLIELSEVDLVIGCK